MPEFAFYTTAAFRSNCRVALNSMAIPNNITIQIVYSIRIIDSNLGAPYSLSYSTYEFQVKNKPYLKFTNNKTKDILRFNFSVIFVDSNFTWKLFN